VPRAWSNQKACQLLTGVCFCNILSNVRVLPGPISFEWDKDNREKNWLKHRVSDQEAEEIFTYPEAVLIEDKKHSGAEKRYLIWGKTKAKRFLAVIFTIRDNKIRIISARGIHQKERRFYEQKLKTNTQV